MRVGRERGRHVCAHRGCMGARTALSLGVRLLRVVLCGAASSEHVSHVTTVESRPDWNAVTCGTIGGTLGSSAPEAERRGPRASRVHHFCGYCTVLYNPYFHPHIT